MSDNTSKDQNEEREAIIELIAENIEHMIGVHYKGLGLAFRGYIDFEGMPSIAQITREVHEACEFWNPEIDVIGFFGKLTHYANEAMQRAVKSAYDDNTPNIDIKSQLYAIVASFCCIAHVNALCNQTVGSVPVQAIEVDLGAFAAEVIDKIFGNGGSRMAPDTNSEIDEMLKRIDPDKKGGLQ